MGSIDAPQSLNRFDLGVWRRAQRDRIIDWRTGIDDAQRDRWGVQITASLLDLLPAPANRIIGFCWPYRAEFDARTVVRAWCDAGAAAALPEVTGKDFPLRFRRWWADAPMRCGAYGIAVPDGTPEVIPEILVLPMNAFDDRGYRLGYGGGYFDRTVAILAPRLVTIGLSHEHCRLPTIYPQAHDRAMDFVVTEAGVYSVNDGLLATVDIRVAGERMRHLLAAWNMSGENI